MAQFRLPDYSVESDARGYAWQLCVFAYFFSYGVDLDHVVHVGWEAWQPQGSFLTLNWDSESSLYSGLRELPDGEVRLFFEWERPEGVDQSWAFDCKSGRALYESDINWAMEVERNTGMRTYFIFPYNAKPFVVSPEDAKPFLTDGKLLVRPYARDLSRTVWHELRYLLRRNHGLIPKGDDIPDGFNWEDFARELDRKVPVIRYSELVKIVGDPRSLFIKER